ncbi:MAG TPA: [protein-PII] uridylyltransferase [Sphingomonadaceae bacterium]|nr:[protein-PII] uridylyltransferase [Sphingomonadaceae bacterium]
MNLLTPLRPDKGDVIDTTAVAAALQALPGTDPSTLRRQGAALLKAALHDAYDRIAARLAAAPGEGMAIAADYARATDAVVALVHEFTMTRLYPLANRTAGERVAVVALGGWGRAEMARHSDVDILFLSPGRRNAWVEQRVETMLYLLWDLGLKLGHQSASVDEMLRLATDDMSVRTALLEARPVCGDGALLDDLAARFAAEVQADTAPDFVAAKLAERNARHVRVGDSRYVVEPDVKNGKGGLRDLHTLLWIGKYAFRVRRAPELVDRGLFTRAELRRFGRAERFFWSVRCHLHVLTGRAEERLGFEAQREIAARMHFADRPGKSAVERFMQFYFRQARTVGHLSGVFLAELDESFAPKGSRFGFPALIESFRRRTARLSPFVLDRGRIAAPADEVFTAEPVRLLQLFALADQHGLEVHPRTMRLAARDARLVDGALREDAAANALFLDVLTSPRDPGAPLSGLNEAGILGRFVPDFGRIVAQMQFDMYHHYTVDEHTIRALDLLSRIERGLLKEDHPLATALFRQVQLRRALFVAVFLHDIAKGRGGDHSELGEAVARQLCPRFGLEPAESETVAWLVRHHLLMARTAFKRDLADPKTIADFAAVVQSPERLRLLMILTSVDIAAVGPGTWTAWKRQLLRTLYDRAEETLRLGHKQRGRGDTVAAAKLTLGNALGWTEARVAAELDALPEAWWIAEPDVVQCLNARLLAETDPGAVRVTSVRDEVRAGTLVTVAAPDRPGLFHAIVAAIGGAGGNIIDARLYTGADGRALDNILVQRNDGAAFDDPTHLARLTDGIRDAVEGRVDPVVKLAARNAQALPPDTFPVQASVLIDNAASNRYTVVEVNAADRPALLGDLTGALGSAGFAIHSAHIATYGTRAVDVFYLTDASGAKITDDARVKALARSLESAAA